MNTQTADLVQYRGKHGTLDVHISGTVIKVDVKIGNARLTSGGIDMKITPVSGTGAAWVDSRFVEIWENGGGVSVRHHNRRFLGDGGFEALLEGQRRCRGLRALADDSPEARARRLKLSREQRDGRKPPH